MLDPVLFHQFEIMRANPFRRSLLALASVKREIIPIQQVCSRLIDVPGIVRNAAALRLSENAIQDSDGDYAAVDQLPEDIARSNAGQLVRIAHQDHFGAWPDA